MKKIIVKCDYCGEETGLLLNIMGLDDVTGEPILYSGRKTTIIEDTKTIHELECRVKKVIIREDRLDQILKNNE